MTKTFSVLAILICTIYFAQGASLTKEETINYINKKLRDVVTDNGYEEWNIIQNELSLDDSKARITRIYVTGTNSPLLRNCAEGYWSFSKDIIEFNPAYIEDIKEGEDSNGVKKMILVIPKTGKHTYLAKKCVIEGDYFVPKVKEDTIEMTKELKIFYNGNDPATFGKLKKAIEYLRDLSKSESDPFGE